MPKRTAQEIMGKQEVAVGSLKSRSGRVVKPKLFEDGTLAQPLVVKEDAAEPAGQEAGEQDRQGGTQAQERGSAEPQETDSMSEEGHSASIRSREGSRNSGRARSGSVGRDDSGKFTVGGPRAKGGNGARSGRGKGESGGGIFKMAAVDVLRHEKRLMSTGDIARSALKRGLIKCTGKTPEATMASALYTDIKRKEGQSVFIRPHEGLFGLREWIEQGVDFQDDYAVEMAKRARASYSAYLGLPGLPASLVGGPPQHHSADKEPAAAAAAAAAHAMAAGAGGGPYHHPGMLHYAGLPPGMPMMPGPFPGQSLSPRALAALAASMAAAQTLGPGAQGQAGEGSQSPDGLMELLVAAEELHRSNSKDAEGPENKQACEERAPSTAEAREKTAPKSAPQPPALAAAEGSPVEGAASKAALAVQVKAEGPGEAAGLGDGESTPTGPEAEGLPGSCGGPSPVSQLQQHQHEQQQQQELCEDAASEPASDPEQQQAAGQAAMGSDEDEDAAALLAAVAAAEGGPTLEQQAAAQHAMSYPYHYDQGGYPYPYHHYYPSYGLPPPPPHGAAGKRRGIGRHSVADAIEEGRDGLLGQLVVRGSNKPFARDGKARPAKIGQEQTNTLNIPLPGIDDEATGDGYLECVALLEEALAGSAVSPEQLKQAEAKVMKMEKDMGAEHPAVGKAYLSLSRLYVADCAESTAKSLAQAALCKAYNIMTASQKSLQRRPTCTSSFSYLVSKLNAPPAQAPLRPLGTAAANGEAAHVSLSAGVAAH